MCVRNQDIYLLEEIRKYQNKIKTWKADEEENKLRLYSFGFFPTDEAGDTSGETSSPELFVTGVQELLP